MKHAPQCCYASFVQCCVMLRLLCVMGDREATVHNKKETWGVLVIVCFFWLLFAPPLKPMLNFTFNLHDKNTLGALLPPPSQLAISTPLSFSFCCLRFLMCRKFPVYTHMHIKIIPAQWKTSLTNPNFVEGQVCSRKIMFMKYHQLWWCSQRSASLF